MFSIALYFGVVKRWDCVVKELKQCSYRNDSCRSDYNQSSKKILVGPVLKEIFLTLHQILLFVFQSSKPYITCRSEYSKIDCYGKFTGEKCLKD